MNGDNTISKELLHLRYLTVERSPDAVLWIDTQGGVHHANEAACRRFGLSPVHSPDITFFDIDANCSESNWPKIQKQLKDSSHTPYATHFFSPQGNPIPVEVTAAKIQFKKRHLLSLFVRDVSLCKRSETASLENEARLRAIGMALPDLVFVLDEDGRHLEVLTSQENLLYVPIDSIQGRRLHEIFDKILADRFLKLARKTIRNKSSGVIEYELPIDGKNHFFEARTAPLTEKINGKRCLVWIARDITERKCAEKLHSQNVYLQEELTRQFNYGEIVGISEAMETVFENIAAVADTDATVMLLGETGTGKELIARAIHKASTRKENPLIKVNCGALPANLAESELFGHEKGAFTGAVDQKTGRFELAHNGTLFLDEVGEITPEIQVKLLRVLQEQEFERVGGTRTVKVDVRIIAATNRDLVRHVKEGMFRDDLYYRLNIFPIKIPPLRERKEDIPMLARHFITTFSERFGRHIKTISSRAMEKLTRNNWPGNVRELANVIERAVILCQGTVIQKKHIRGLSRDTRIANRFLTLKEMECRHIQEALKRADGVIGGRHGAAHILDINRSTLWSRMQRLGIRVDKKISGHQ